MHMFLQVHSARSAGGRTGRERSLRAGAHEPLVRHRPHCARLLHNNFVRGHVPSRRAELQHVAFDGPPVCHRRRVLPRRTLFALLNTF